VTDDISIAWAGRAAKVIVLICILVGWGSWSLDKILSEMFSKIGFLKTAVNEAFWCK